MASAFQVGEKCVCIHKTVRYAAIISNIKTKDDTLFYQIHFSGYNKRTDIMVEVGKEEGILEKRSIDNTKKIAGSSEPDVKRKSTSRKRHGETLANTEQIQGEVIDSLEVSTQNTVRTGTLHKLTSCEQNIKKMPEMNSMPGVPLEKKCRIVGGDEKKKQVRIDERTLASSVPTNSPDSQSPLLPNSSATIPSEEFIHAHNSGLKSTNVLVSVQTSIQLTERLRKILKDDYYMLTSRGGICIQPGITITSLYNKYLDYVEKNCEKELNAFDEDSDTNERKIVESRYETILEFTVAVFDYFEKVTATYLLNSQERKFAYARMHQFATRKGIEIPSSPSSAEISRIVNAGYHYSSHFGIVMFVRFLAIIPFIQSEFPFNMLTSEYSDAMTRLVNYVDLLSFSKYRKCTEYAPSGNNTTEMWRCPEIASLRDYINYN